MEQLEQPLEQYKLAELEKLLSVPMAGPVQLLVLQPTPFCNLDCDYCYLPHRDDRSRMSPETLSAIGRALGADIVDHSVLTVVWHGGEPMTLSPDWYAEAFDILQSASGHRLRHAFQTNAVGINDAWLRLWRDWEVSVGVSLDGPADFHDQHRRTRNGRGSHGLTMKGVAALQAADHRFHVISVLTEASLAAPDRLFEFYADHGINDIAFNIEEKEGAHSETSLDTPDIAQAYHRFMTRFQDRMAAHPSTIRCREVEAVRGLIRMPAKARAANAQCTPLNIVSVAADGGLSTFSPEFIGVPAPAFDNFLFGNIRDGGFDTILNHPAFQKLYSDILIGQRACAAQCAYFDVCGGGAPANKYFELGSCKGTETLYCRLTCMTTLEAVLAHMEAQNYGAA